MVVIIIMLVLFLIVVFGINLITKKEQKNRLINKQAILELETKIKGECKQKNIEITNFLYSSRYDVFIFDDKNKKLAFFQNTQRADVLWRIENFNNITENLTKINFNPKIIDYKNITAAEIVIDDNTITKTSRGSQIGGALIGGVIAGGLGALIGGLSGSTKSNKKIKKMKLKIYLNTSSESTLVIEYLENQFGIDADSKYSESVLKSIEEVYDILKVILATKKDEEQLVNFVPGHSLVDQLKELSDLYRDGNLNKNEYDKAKEKILN